MPKAIPPNANSTTSRATPRTNRPLPTKTRAPATVLRTPILSTSRPQERLPIRPPMLTNVKTSPSFKAGITSATSIFPKLSIAPYPKAHTKGYTSKRAKRHTRLTGPTPSQALRHLEPSAAASPAGWPSSNTPSRTNPTRPNAHNAPKKARYPARSMSGNSNAGPTIRDRVETNRTAPIRVPSIPGCEVRLTARETHGWNAARPTAWTARRLSTCHSSAQKGSKTQGKVKPNAPTIHPAPSHMTARPRSQRC